MGIVTSIISRIALPLGIAVVAGIVLSRFKDQILGTISAGAGVVGQSISQPISSVIQGFSQGLQGIPQFIDVNIPQFRFGFADSGQLQAPPAGDAPFMGGTITTPEGCFVDSLGRIDCPTPPIFTPSPPNQVGGSPTPAPSPLSIFQGSSFRIGVTLPSGFSGIRTRGEIIQANPDAIGLFDLLDTSKTEFIPLSAQQVAQQQNNLRLSAQLFNEAKNIQEALSFA